MTDYFAWLREGEIITKTKMGVEITVHFDDTAPSTIEMDGQQWDIDDDALYDIAVLARNGYGAHDFVTLWKLVQYAADEYPQMLAEAKLEAAAQERHERSMSDSSRFI